MVRKQLGDITKQVSLEEIKKQVGKQARPGDPEDWVRYDTMSSRTALPMAVLALLFVFIAVVPLIEDLSTESLAAIALFGWVLWMAFVVEYVMRLLLAPDRRWVIRNHKLDLLFVALPFLRLFQLARVAQLVRLSMGGKLGDAVRKLMGRPGFKVLVGGALVTILAGGLLVTIVEHEQEGSSINNIWDGFWWAVVTCTTVGYGDTFPVTNTGRGVAVVLMILGIAMVSMITANIAAYFVEEADEEEDAERSGEMAELKAQLDRIEAKLDGRS